ncbi:hypothetical protein HDU77_000853 [Chytriomyces hyalinus]|nr:hypothetical protein HDU77_000853 [Chytriomyces hyalinus]
MLVQTLHQNFVANNQLNRILGDLNKLSKATSPITVQQIIDELELKGASEESLIQKYWQGVEDVYHWQFALSNFVKFYEKRIDNQNGHWTREIIAVDSCDSPLSTKEAFKAVLMRKQKEEMGFLQQGQDLALHYTTSRKPYLNSHLNQVHEGFKQKIHKFHFKMTNQ